MKTFDELNGAVIETIRQFDETFDNNPYVEMRLKDGRVLRCVAWAAFGESNEGALSMSSLRMDVKITPGNPSEGLIVELHGGVVYAPPNIPMIVIDHDTSTIEYALPSKDRPSLEEFVAVGYEDKR